MKILRQRRVHLHVLPGGGMAEAQHLRVERLPPELKGGYALHPRNVFPIAPVQLVPQQRVAQRGHMHPDLMRPAGLQDTFYIGMAPEPLQHTVIDRKSVV